MLKQRELVLNRVLPDPFGLSRCQKRDHSSLDVNMIAPDCTDTKRRVSFGFTSGCRASCAITRMRYLVQPKTVYIFSCSSMFSRGPTNTAKGEPFNILMYVASDDDGQTSDEEGTGEGQD